MLPDLTPEGYLPVGVHSANWDELQLRFGRATSRRLWLFRELESIVALAAATKKLRRVFIWGSFVTAKPAPGDLDLLLVMSDDFETEQVDAVSRPVFDSTRAKLSFEADVFWTRASIGAEVLQIWLETYQTSRDLRKRGIVELELP